jgi:hypothetical protein
MNLKNIQSTMLRLRNLYYHTGNRLPCILPVQTRSSWNLKASPNNTWSYAPSHSYSQSSGRSDDVKEDSVKRAKKGDTRDPGAAAVASGLKEREANQWIADDSKSGATTERGGRKQAAKAKREYPAAPEPIIGMNDERARVSTFSCLTKHIVKVLTQFVVPEGWLVAKFMSLGSSS